MKPLLTLALFALSVPMAAHAQGFGYYDGEDSAQRSLRHIREAGARQRQNYQTDRQLRKIEEQNQAILEDQARAREEAEERARIEAQQRAAAEEARQAAIRARQAEELAQKRAAFNERRRQHIMAMRGQLPSKQPASLAPVAKQAPPKPALPGFAMRTMSDGRVIVLESSTGHMHRFSGESEAQAFMAAARQAAYAEVAK